MFPGPKQILDDNTFEYDYEMERFATRMLKTGHVVISANIRRLVLRYLNALVLAGIM